MMMWPFFWFAATMFLSGYAVGLGQWLISELIGYRRARKLWKLEA